MMTDENKNASKSNQQVDTAVPKGAEAKPGEKGIDKLLEDNKDQGVTGKRGIDQVSEVATEPNKSQKVGEEDNQQSGEETILQYVCKNPEGKWDLVPYVQTLLVKYDGQLDSVNREDLEEYKVQLKQLGVDGQAARKQIEEALLEKIFQRNELNTEINTMQSKRVGFSDMIGKAIGTHNAIDVHLATADKAQAAMDSALTAKDAEAEAKAKHFADFQAAKHARLMAIFNEECPEYEPAAV